MDLLVIRDKILGNKIYLFGLIGLVLILLIIVFILAFRSPKEEVISLQMLGSGLVSFWPFEEKDSQIVYDAVSQQNNGRLGFSPGQDSADPKRIKGVFGNALQFDGKDDYVIVLDSPSLHLKREITLEGWFQLQGTAQSQSLPVWLPDFKYRKRIVVDNTRSRDSFQNFQLPLIIDTASLITAGKMQANCQDIRLTDADETTLLDYWLESGCNTQETKVWVKVPELRAGSTKHLFLYYGNNTVESTSDFYRTMETPPALWWKYASEKIRYGPKIQSLAVRGTDIILVGSDVEPGSQQWHAEVLNGQGSITRHFARDFSSGPDVINAAAFDDQGNIILAGYDSLEGDLQWRVAKFSYNFYEQWSKTFNFSSGSDEIRAVAVDAENNIILAGYDSVPGDSQWRILKLRADGEKLWEYSLNPSSKADSILDVAVDSRNNIIVAGFEKLLGNDEWRIMKFDAQGRIIYTYRLNVSQGADVPNSLIVDSQDNIIVVGYDFYHGDAQWRIVKLDGQEGASLWQWSFNPSSGFDELKAVATDSEDNIIVAGYDSELGQYRWNLLKFPPFPKEGQEVIDKIWEWSYDPSSNFDELRDMVTDGENNIILVGSDFSVRRDPEWQAIKFGEKKPIFPQPAITLMPEQLPFSLPANSILVKAGSFGIRATQQNIIAVINESKLSAPFPAYSDWIQFALTYDGLYQKLYLNGHLANSLALTGEIEVSPDNLFLGYNFAGIIDDLKIYNRALSAEEIRKLYNLKNLTKK